MRIADCGIIHKSQMKNSTNKSPIRNPQFEIRNQEGE